MARHTTCTTVAGVWPWVPGVDFGLGIVGIVGLITAPVILAIAALSAAGITPASMIIAASILQFACLFAINLLQKVRDYFFDHRLVCLDGDRCALGQVNTMEDNGDGDKSMNLVLAPATGTTTPTDYASWFQPASLVFVDPGLATRGFHLDPAKARKPLFGAGLPLFHAEIEGTYLDTLTLAVLAWLWTIFALAVAAMIAASAALALGPFAWAIWIALAILVILAILLSQLFGLSDADSTDAGPVGDATPTPGGPIITDVGGQTINKNDYVAVIGRHVCDTGHNPPAWDELHTVTGIAKISEREYHAVPTSHTAGDLYDQYCDALHRFVDGVGEVKQALETGTSDGTSGSSTQIPCLEHERIG
jgi:hypothetical protein